MCSPWTGARTASTGGSTAGKAWVFDDTPYFLLLNLAVGGKWPGYPDATTQFPQEYRVDYVRVYGLA
jgi:beta-glucanase (GH16 family)